MRKYIFITLLIALSCTEKKVQHQTDGGTVEPPLEETKKYVFEDSATVKVEVFTDSTENVFNDVVEAPAVDEAEDAQPDTLVVDTTLYTYSLTLPQDSANAWKNLKGFAYTKYLDSLLKAEKNKNQPKKETNQPRGESWLDGLLSSGGLQFFLWIFAGAFVIFILYKLFITGGPMRRSSTKNTPAPLAEEETITAESDFDRLIREAVQQRNYRLAVRYHYLQTLHQLAQKNYVQLAADKTNYQYVRELADVTKQNEFASLTLNYEYVWYGEFAIDEIQYIKIKTGFAAFNTKIG